MCIVIKRYLYWRYIHNRVLHECIYFRETVLVYCTILYSLYTILMNRYTSLYNRKYHEISQHMGTIKAKEQNRSRGQPLHLFCNCLIGLNSTGYWIKCNLFVSSWQESHNIVPFNVLWLSLRYYIHKCCTHQMNKYSNSQIRAKHNQPYSLYK